MLVIRLAYCRTNVGCMCKSALHCRLKALQQFSLVFQLSIMARPTIGYLLQPCSVLFTSLLPQLSRSAESVFPGGWGKTEVANSILCWSFFPSNWQARQKSVHKLQVYCQFAHFILYEWWGQGLWCSSSYNIIKNCVYLPETVIGADTCSTPCSLEIDSLSGKVLIDSLALSSLLL